MPTGPNAKKNIDPAAMYGYGPQGGNDEVDYGYEPQVDYGYGDQTDYGYGDQTDYGYEPQTDYGYGDQTDYGYEPQTDYGYGDSAPQQATPPPAATETKERGPRRHRSVRRNSCVVRKEGNPLAVAEYLMGGPPLMSDRDLEADKAQQQELMT